MRHSFGTYRLVLHFALVAIALAFGTPTSAHMIEPPISIQHETMPLIGSVVGQVDPELIACCNDDARSDSPPVCHTACPSMTGCGFSMVPADSRFESLFADRLAFRSSIDSIVGIAVLPPTPPPKARV